ncbi:transposase, partial [Vibrio parahaemolyticus]|nr:transposase [Vibrio parahaemolyticus]
CPSLTVKLQNHVAAAVAPAYQELVDELPSEKNLLIDESPTKQENTKAWLWAMLAAHFTVFTIRLTRAATVLDEFLGEKFNGIVN